MSHYSEPDAHLFRDALFGIGSGIALVSPVFGVALYCRETMYLWALALAHVMI